MSSNTNTDIWFAGAFAAFTVDLLVYPLDTLKTRIQSPHYTKLYKHANGSVNRAALFRGLYQGVGSIILITIPSSGAFFTTYEALKYALHEHTPPNSTIYVPQALIHGVSSAGAELVSCAILTPAEVLKQNAQVYNAKSKGKSPTLEVLKQFRRHPKQLMRGYTALAARNLPFTGLQFPLFEHLKERFIASRKAQKNGDATMGILERASITAMSGSLAGTGAAWITTPIDVVKTRIMLAAGEETAAAAHQSGEQNKEKGMNRVTRKSGWLVATEVLKTDGVRGLFRGAALRSVWTAMGSGLYLGCYEGGRFYLEDQRKAADLDEGDSLMGKKWEDVKVGIGNSRSQGETVKKSAWQDD